jgi:hypothetical protein
MIVLHDNVLKLKKLRKVVEYVAQYRKFSVKVVEWQGDECFVRYDDSCELLIDVIYGC